MQAAALGVSCSSRQWQAGCGHGRSVVCHPDKPGTPLFQEQLPSSPRGQGNRASSSRGLGLRPFLIMKVQMGSR